MPDRSEQVPVIAVASGKGGVGKGGRDADERRPVMVTCTVREQVAAHQLIAEQVGKLFTSS